MKRDTSVVWRSALSALSVLTAWSAAGLVVLALVALSSCTREPLLPPELPSTDYMDLSLELNPPGEFTTASKAMSDADQNKIATAHVLVFRNDTIISQQAGTISNPSGVKTNVTVKLKTSQSETDLFDIMVIGNPPTGFNFAAYKTKAELKTALTAPITTKWTTAPFAMYGEVLKTLIKPAVNKFKIQMLRSLARIDIGVGAYTAGAAGTAGTWAGLTGIFSLTAVYVYNTRNKFAVIPNETTLNAAGNIKVDAHTIPSGTAINTVPWTYVATDIVGGKAVQSTIFLAEAPNDANRVTLVVGGRYKNSNATTYYRIDMCVPKADKTGYDYLNILRNHLYRINIVSVSGEGLASAELALTSDPINITTTLTPIEEGGSGDVIFDGKNYLMTDVSSVLIYGEPDGVKSYAIATVKATFAAGVPATISGPGYATPIALTSGVPKEISYVIPKATTKGDFTIKVGSLSKVIPFTVQAAIDAHFDFLPFMNVASITVEKPQSWLTLSQNSTYVAKEQQSSQVTGNKDGKAYLYFDENIVHAGEAPRTARALVQRTGAGGTTRVYVEQLNLSGMVIGKFGGTTDSTGYTKQLAFELIEEFCDRLYDDTSITTPRAVSGIQWGFNGVTTGTINIELGQVSTTTLARRTDSGITGALTIYNNYAARYCYDKNRDTNGNGTIDDGEVVWYLPAQNQMAAAWIAKEALTVKPFPAKVYWSATERSISQSWFVIVQDGRTSYAYGNLKNFNGAVRCIRDI